MWVSRHLKLSLYIAAILCPLLEILNSVYFQPISTLNTNYILLENFAIILMALIYLYIIILNDYLSIIIRDPHFWFWSLFLVLSSGTFFFWIYIKMPSGSKKNYIDFAQNIQAIVNLLVYSGVGVIFFLYPKMRNNVS